MAVQKKFPFALHRLMEKTAPLILVVDDEPAVAAVACFCLERGGFRVLSATSSRQAINLWEDEIVLLLTDFMMPELSGDELALFLLKRKPDLKIILMSGTPLQPINTEIQLQENYRFLLKPFGINELVSLVKSLL